MVRVGAEELCWDDKECIAVRLEHCMVIFLRHAEFSLTFGTLFTETKKQNTNKGSQHTTRGFGVES